MKVNFKHAMVACTALLLGATSCVKTTGGDNNVTKPGERTYMTVEMKFPATTRVTDAGTTGESAISTVTVFIFDGQMLSGNPINLNFATQFEETSPGSGKWVTKADAAIATTTGQKSVYVGLNLPAAWTAPGAVISVSDLTDVVRNAAITDLVTFNANKAASVAMFSITPGSGAFQEYDPGQGQTMPASNKVSVAIERMVTKAAVERDQNLALTIANYGTFSNLQSRVMSVLEQTYISQNVDLVTNYVKSPNWEDDHIGNQLPPATLALYNNAAYSYVNVDNHGTSRNDLAFQYATENTNEIPRDGNTTYSSIKATFTPSVVYDNANFPGTNVTADWVATAYNGAATTIWMAEHKVGTNPQRFFLSKEKADGYILAYTATNGGVNTDHFNVDRNYSGTLVTVYTDGACYWPVRHNNEGVSGIQGIYQTYRNDFYHMTINKITGIGKGVDTPDPTNPPLIQPTTNIEVTMEIVPWNYILSGIVL